MLEKNKQLNVIISTGQGRLHLIQSAKAIEEVDCNVKIITGWIPSKKIPDNFINKLGLLIGRKNLADGLRKRNVTDFDEKSVFSCGFSEFFLQFLMILTRFKLITYETTTTLGWKFFGMQSKSYINTANIFHVRSGAGHGGAIEKARKKGMKVLIDHSIAHPNEVYNQLLKISNKSEDKSITINPNSKFWKLILEDCKLGDAILVNSNYVKESFIQNGFDGSNIYVAELGISETFFSLKKDWRITDDTIKLIFTGGFGKRKGANLIVETIHFFIKNKIKFQLDVLGVVIGDVILPDWFLKSPFVKLHGFLPQEIMKNFLINADVYIFPSYSEGAAQSVKEAMAIGIPVVATKQSGAPLIHEVNSLVVKDHSSEELIKAVLRLKEDSDLREKIGLNASKTIKEDHTWLNYAEKVNNVYNIILDCNGRK